MILNACVRDDKMTDENICRICRDKSCRHAGEPTVQERLDIYTYGTSSYWSGEIDDAI